MVHVPADWNKIHYILTNLIDINSKKNTLVEYYRDLKCNFEEFDSDYRMIKTDELQYSDDALPHERIS